MVAYLIQAQSVWTANGVVQKKRERPARSEGLNNSEIYSTYLAEDLSRPGVKEYVTSFGQQQAEKNPKQFLVEIIMLLT